MTGASESEHDFDEKFLEIWIVEKYDEVVAQHPDGIAVDDTRELLARAYVEGVARGDLPRVRRRGDV